MATTFTDNYQIKLIGTGLEAGTWGLSTNENLKRIEQALGSAVSINPLAAPTGSTNASADGVTAMIWITQDTSNAGVSGSEGRSAFVEFKNTGSLTGDIRVKVRGSTSGEVPDRIYLVRNNLSDSKSLILNADADGTADELTILNGSFALVAVYGGATAGGITTESVFNVLSKLQIDDLVFPAAADINLLADDTAALEIKDSAGTYIKVDTTTEDLSATPPEHPVVNLMTRDVVTGVSGATSVIKSSGDADLTLKTGNDLTGSISIVDGDSGAISITPETAGKIVVGETARSATITGITKGSTTQVANSGTNTFVFGEVVKIVGVVDSATTGDLATALNGNTFTLSAVDAGGAHFTLAYSSSGLSATWASGGSATSADPLHITTSGTNNLVLDTNSGTDSGSITITEAADKNILIEPDGSGKVIVGHSGATGKISTGGARDLVIGTNDTTAYFTDATCDITSGDATVGMDSTSSIAAGMAVLGDGIPAGRTVSSITNSTTFELSGTASATATNTTLTFGGPGAEIKVEDGINGGIVLRSINSGVVTIADNAIISSTDGYLNFDDVSGSTGYGFRNNNRAPQVKHFNWDWYDVIPNVRSAFYELDNGGTDEAAEAVTSSDGTSNLTFNALDHTAEVGDYVYPTGLVGTIGTSAFDLTTLNNTWWKIASVVAGETFTVDILTTITGTATDGGTSGKYQLNVPGAATVSSGTGNKKGSITIGPLKIYFDRLSGSSVDLSSEFSVIWNVIGNFAQDTGSHNDNAAAWVNSDGTTIDMFGEYNKDIVVFGSPA